MTASIVFSTTGFSPATRFTGRFAPAITVVMNDDALTSPWSPVARFVPADLPAAPSESAVAAWPREARLTCPLGRPTRLIAVSAANGLVECRPAQAGHCPNFMSFGGGFFCRAHLADPASAAGRPAA